MKTYIAILLLSFASLNLQAQELIIHKTDGSMISVLLSSIDSITFYSMEVFVCGESTISDIEGNTYSTVQIDNRCWMAENLKTTTYRNNTPIEYPGESNADWTSNTSGAYAWYYNDIGWKDSYGALYNFYALVNPNGICPEGWHVPTDEDWTSLIGFVEGPNSIKGNKLKSCRRVDSPLGDSCAVDEHPRWNSYGSTYGTDDYGFSGLPGGGRNQNGQWYNVGITGNWWSSTESSYNKAWLRFLNYYDGAVNRVEVWRNTGYSIRCIKE
jgi:uncharacterized protein (TIGR02145 family)